MTQFTHYGLFFTEGHVQRAQKNRNKAPFATAFALLDAPHENINAEMLLNGYRYRLGNNMAGEQARDMLAGWIQNASSETIMDALQQALLTGQVIELIRPLLSDTPHIRQWYEHVRQYIDYQTDHLQELLWQGVLMMTIGIIDEQEQMIQQAVTRYQTAIDDWLHPEGYMPHIIDKDDETTNFRHQIQATQALALMAEMAKHIGIDLYGYNKRGVSVLTACAYPLYYYFYPEKWRWSGDPKRASDGIPEETAKTIFKAHIGFIEIIADHYKPPLKAIQMILDDLRPCFDPLGGGLTTLTHAPAPRRGLFG